VSVKEIAFGLDTARDVTTQADFTYSITPNTISIIDSGKGRRSVTKRYRGCLAKD
jgi:hypothetical protein